MKKNVIVICIVLLSSSLMSQNIYNGLFIKAITEQKYEDASYWLEKGADVNYIDKNQQSALHLVILNTHNFEIMNFLLTKKINPNIKDSKGITPLMLAAFNGFTNWCLALYENGALLDLKDNDGFNALDYAEVNCNYKVIEFLKNPKSYAKSPDYIDWFFKAMEFEEKKDYETAIKYAVQARELSEVETCENNITYILTWNKLGTLYLQVGKNKEAIPLLKNAMSICKKKMEEGSNDFRFSELYMSLIPVLGGLYIRLGYYYEAESFYMESLASLKEFFGENHANYIESLFDLGRLYLVMENYSKALPFCEQGLKSLKELKGENNLEYISYLSMLGDVYMKSGNYLKAENIYEQSLKSSRELIGETNSNYANSLFKLGHLYLLSENYSKAKPLLENALSISEGLSSKDNSTILSSLAYVYWAEGDYSQAEPMLELSLMQNKENKFTTQEVLIRSNIYIGAINEEMKNYNKALTYYLEAFTEIKDYTFKNFDFLSEKGRGLFWDVNNIYSYHTFPSFTYTFIRETKTHSFAYDNLLFSKGLLIIASQKTSQTILNSGDSILIKRWEKMKSLRRQIFYVESMPKEKQADLNKLEEEADQLDNILMQESQTYRQLTTKDQICWKDVQSKLKKGEVAIEFSSFQYYNKNWTDSTIFCALILKKGMEYPEMIPLFEQKQLDSLLIGGNAAPNMLYASRGVSLYSEDQTTNGQKLYNLIWKPLEKELKDVTTVYYSPSGSLHQVAFSALPIDTKTYLCDKYNLVQLSSTRQLATSAWQTKPGQISSTALFGGIKYDLENQEIAELQQSLPQNDLALARGFTADSSLRSTTFGYLPGTRAEVNSISNTLWAKKIKTVLYTGIDGNEESFKALSNQNNGVLHIATHGFFFPDEKEKPQYLDRLMLMGEQKFRYVPNPLRRSGLVLAGGNRSWSGEDPIAGMEDGILTAQEISEMNLQNTELVVLSACETGLGDIKGGEGVFGLQRAFKLAGVKTIIMSLWKVPDGSTAEMMQLFYSKWLGGIDKHEAFRETQREMRKRYPKSPKDWAGFVMLD